MILMVFLSILGNLFLTIQPVLISGLMEITIGEQTSIEMEAQTSAQGV